MYSLYILFFIFFIFLLYLFSIKPNKKRNLDFLLGRYYSHRGLHDNTDINPENSLLSFQMAADKSFGIEFDVQVTKDRIPVVFHDDKLKRVCQANGQIPRLKFKDLEDLRLFNSEQYIPTLKETLELISGRVPLIIEIKSSSSDVSQLKYIAELLDAYKGPYVIESFNPAVLIWYKKNRPHIIRGQLSSYFKKKNHSLSRRFRDFFLENLITNFLTKPDFIAFNYRYKHMFSFRLCKMLYNPMTATYTIKSQKSLDNNLKDFDLFIFDSFIPEKYTGNIE